MSFHVLIPARLASARLPNKPLADIGGAPMVVRVAQQALRSQAAQVVVAADSAAIADACAAHGIRAVLTDPDHPSGSDRLAQACALLGLDGDAMVVNVQGDEPLIDPALINAVAAGRVERDATIMLNITGGGEEHFKEGKELWYLKPSLVFPLDPDADDVVSKVEALF